MRIAVVRGNRATLFNPSLCFTGEVEEVFSWLKDQRVEQIALLAPHGGPNHFKPSKLKESILEEIAPFSGPMPLARRLLEAPSTFKTTLFFDTAFYQTLPLESSTLGVSEKAVEKGIRRYGVHGYALESIVTFGKPLGKTVVAYCAPHSCAVALMNGVAIDTKANLLSWERPAAMDRTLFTTFPEVLKGGGIKALSTAKSFEELVLETPHQMKAMLAFETYALEIKRAIGAMAASLGGIDTLVFSGSWGERFPELRQEIAGGLEFLGVELDKKKNLENQENLTYGATQIRIIPSREDLILYQKIDLLRN